MNSQKLSFVRELAPLLLMAGLLLQGCSKSNPPSSDATTAADIRGEPINSPVSISTQQVARSTAALGSEEKGTSPTSAAGTNAVLDASGKPGANHGKEAANAGEPEFLAVGFEKLASFTFEVPDEQPGTNKVANPTKSESQIPVSIKALDQKRVTLKGFMLPLKVESGLVTEMLIMRDQSMCCYGTVPKITEWVSVKMADKGVKPIMDQPVTIFGKLKVGEIRENGYLVGIYQMDGEKMAGPADL